MAQIAHGNIGSVTVEVKPTVTLESAVACVMMLNMFLADNEEYALHVGEDGKVSIHDMYKPTTRDKVAEHFGVSTAYLGSVIPPQSALDMALWNASHPYKESEDE